MSLPIEQIRILLIEGGFSPVYLGLTAPSQEDQAIWVNPTGGLSPVLQQGSCGKIFESSMQILVRGCPHDFEGAYKLARKVQFFLISKTTDDIFDTKLLNSDPLNLGKDKEDRYIFTVNILTKTTE